MNNSKNTQNINFLIDKILASALSFISYTDTGDIKYVDPIEDQEIRAHYGNSHLMVSLLLLGKIRNDKELYDTGTKLLKNLIENFNSDSKLPGYHNDFNNFAFCLAYKIIEDDGIKSEIKRILLLSHDSNHPTINWLPMRIMTNHMRFDFSGDNQYIKRAKEFGELITHAYNSDGGIEDRLPYGTSFNLQYCISSYALLYYLNSTGLDSPISSQTMNFLLNAIAPDGDINYQGRGTNQIFAWGPWIYLLVKTSEDNNLGKAIAYLNSNISSMLDNNSLMLNQWDAKERFLWWDYHYSSVYIAHLLLWLVLSIDSSSTKFHYCKLNSSNETGFKIFRSRRCFIAKFEGRKEYLAEMGPSIPAMYIDNKPIVKATLGPWRGMFGNRNPFEFNVILNKLGLFRTNYKNSLSLINRAFRRLGLNINSSYNFNIEPLFTPIEAKIENEKIYLKFSDNSEGYNIFNIPLLNMPSKIELKVDGKRIKLVEIAAIRNQYGWNKILQTQPTKGKSWELFLE